MVAELADDVALVAEFVAEVAALVALVAAFVAEVAAADALEVADAASTIRLHFAASVLLEIGCAPLEV